MSFTIGQIAKMAGVNVETIRFYERKGLLKPAGRQPSGFRQFSTDAVTRIRFIKRSQELGFSLVEIKELLALRVDSDSVCADVKSRTEAKVHVIEQKLEDLQRIRSVLLRLLETCDQSGTSEECPLLDALEESNGAPFTAGKGSRV
jgi:Hg(II)-responsive transcriptional regulator